MADDLSNMTQSQRDALAQRALKQQKAARSRAEAYRARKQDAGLVQLSVWVPKSKAKQAKKAFGEYAQKLMNEKPPQSPGQS